MIDVAEMDVVWNEMVAKEIDVDDHRAVIKYLAVQFPNASLKEVAEAIGRLADYKRRMAMMRLAQASLLDLLYDRRTEGEAQ